MTEVRDRQWQLMSQATDAKAKNELLFSKFGINYNQLPPRYRKGSTIVRNDPDAVPQDAGDPSRRAKRKPYEGTIGTLAVLHEDIIKDAFWIGRPWLLA